MVAGEIFEMSKSAKWRFFTHFQGSTDVLTPILTLLPIFGAEEQDFS
jgi:hypothetical protein